MADFYHGVSTRQVETSVSTPVEADSGVPFVVGTAPVHTVGGKVNVPILAYTYEEAVTALGFSDNWGDYTLCEMIYSHYRLYERAPVVFVNVLDPEKHRKQTAETNYPVKDGKVYLPLEAMKETVTVKGGADATAFTEGEDYELFYDGENLILEIVEGSAIPEDLGELSITFYSVDPSQVTKKEIIGGFDVNTKKYSGFELMDSVFAKYTIVGRRRGNGAALYGRSGVEEEGKSFLQTAGCLLAYGEAGGPKISPVRSDGGPYGESGHGQRRLPCGIAV